MALRSLRSLIHDCTRLQSTLLLLLPLTVSGARASVMERPYVTPEHPEIILDRANSFQSSPATDCAEAMGQVETLYLAITVLQADSYFDFEIGDTSLQVRTDTLRAVIDRILCSVLAADSACPDAYLYLAWPAAKRMAYEDSALSRAKQVYRTGLRHSPRNAELKARLAYGLEISDSLEAARNLYEQVVDEGVQRIDIPQALERIRMHELFLGQFFSQPDDNFLMLQTMRSYAPWSTICYCRIRANGECEYRDFFAGSDKPVEFQRHLDSTEVHELVAGLLRLGFLSLHNIYSGSPPGGTDFNRGKQGLFSRLYRVAVQASGFEHTVCASGLSVRDREREFDGEFPTSVHTNEVAPPESHVMNKLDSLAAWWSRVFTLDWVDLRIDSLYGAQRPLVPAEGSYRYARSSDTFVKIAVPDLQAVWRITRDRRPQIDPQDVQNTVLFEIDGELYAYCGTWGRLIYTLPRDSTSFPYLRRRGSGLYFGGASRDSLKLQVRSVVSGRELFTLTSGLDGESPQLVAHRNVDSHFLRQAEDEMKRLSKWVQNFRE